MPTKDELYISDSEALPTIQPTLVFHVTEDTTDTLSIKELVKYHTTHHTSLWLSMDHETFKLVIVEPVSDLNKPTLTGDRLSSAGNIILYLIVFHHPSKCNLASVAFAPSHPSMISFP